jgi:hypothetical protein
MVARRDPFLWSTEQPLTGAAILELDADTFLSAPNDVIPAAATESKLVEWSLLRSCEPVLSLYARRRRLNFRACDVVRRSANSAYPTIQRTTPAEKPFEISLLIQ